MLDCAVTARYCFCCLRQFRCCCCCLCNCLVLDDGTCNVVVDEFGECFSSNRKQNKLILNLSHDIISYHIQYSIQVIQYSVLMGSSSITPTVVIVILVLLVV